MNIDLKLKLDVATALLAVAVHKLGGTMAFTEADLEAVRRMRVQLDDDPATRTRVIRVAPRG